MDEKYIFCEYKGPSTGWASGSELKNSYQKKSKTRTSSSCDIGKKNYKYYREITAEEYCNFTAVKSSRYILSRDYYQICSNLVDKINSSSKQIASLTPESSRSTSSWDTRVCERATKLDGSSFESLSSSYKYYVQEAISLGFNLETCNQITGRGKNQTVTQTVQIPKTKVDKTAPVLT